jgi:hypothetical protein
MLVRTPDLRLFLLLLCASSLLIVIGRGLMLLGFGPLGLLVGGPGVLLVAVLFWCLAFYMAPRLTRQATAALCCAVMVLSLLSLWIDHSREQARRQQAINNLRQVGIGFQEHTSFSPPPQRPQPAWLSQLPRLETDFIIEPAAYQLPAP